MSEVFANNHASFWTRVANGEPYDFDEAFVTKKLVYSATTDFPSALYWKEQLARYPNAKVILSVRDPEKWYKSCTDTIFSMQPGSPHAGLGAQIAVVAMGLYPMFASFFVRDFLRGSWEKSSVIKCFNEHNARVIAECPKDKLLVFEVGQGWEPICTFLNKPIPAEPFPNVNDTKEFQKHVFFASMVGYGLLALAVMPVAGLCWYVGRGGDVKGHLKMFGLEL